MIDLAKPDGGPDRALAAWNRVQHHANGLFEALDRLDELGGPGRAAAAGGWSPAAMDRALASLQAAREGLDDAIIRLDERRKHYPRRRRLG